MGQSYDPTKPISGAKIPGAVADLRAEARDYQRHGATTEGEKSAMKADQLQSSSYGVSRLHDTTDVNLPLSTATPAAQARAKRMGMSQTKSGQLTQTRRLTPAETEEAYEVSKRTAVKRSSAAGGRKIGGRR